SDYHPNLGKGFDEKCVRSLRVNYDQLVERVKEGDTDEEILQWCFGVGRKPSEDDVYVWNEFMRKRGWNDEVSEILARRKADAAMSDRSDIQTAFQSIASAKSSNSKVRSICFFSSSHSGIFFMRSFSSAVLIKSAITAQRVTPENRFATPNRAALKIENQAKVFC